MIVVVAACCAGVIGAFAPFILARLSEPDEPDDDKVPYADLARTRLLGVWSAIGAIIAAAVLALRVEPAWLLPAWVLIAGIGAWLAFIDWRTQLLPRKIVNPLSIVVLLLIVMASAVEADWWILGRALITAAIVFVIFFGSNIIYPKGLGFGDVRLSFPLGLALGAISAEAAVFGLWLGFALGAVGSIILSAMKLVDIRAFAFGPYLIIGAVVGACWTPLAF